MQVVPGATPNMLSNNIIQGLTFPKKLANSIGQLANLVYLKKIVKKKRLADICPSWQTRMSPGLQTVCKRWETSGLQTGFAKVCKPGRNFRRVCKITVVCYPIYAYFDIVGGFMAVLWHFFWQFLFLVGWPTLANVCKRWLANILDSLPTGSEKNQLAN